ncbi:MAG: zinc ribbon domain-containing protein [Peptococcaceae bacterium]|nr:zinc ribbon domain-containing protein [Peptococcaceae bacterium]
MDFLQRISEKAKNLGGLAKEATRKSGDLIEVTKIKYELAKLEKEMEYNLTGLGLLYFQKHRGEEGLEGEIDRLIQSTGLLEEERVALEQEIEKLLPKGLTCSDCAVDLPAGGKYCSYCGSKIDKDD